jgi:hypothetical protein
MDVRFEIYGKAKSSWARTFFPQEFKSLENELEWLLEEIDDLTGANEYLHDYIADQEKELAYYREKARAPWFHRWRWGWAPLVILTLPLIMNHLFVVYGLLG